MRRRADQDLNVRITLAKPWRKISYLASLNVSRLHLRRVNSLSIKRSMRTSSFGLYASTRSGRVESTILSQPILSTFLKIASLALPMGPAVNPRFGNSDSPQNGLGALDLNFCEGHASTGATWEKVVASKVEESPASEVAGLFGRKDKSGERDLKRDREDFKNWLVRDCSTRCGDFRVWFGPEDSDLTKSFRWPPEIDFSLPKSVVSFDIPMELRSISAIFKSWNSLDFAWAIALCSVRSSPRHNTFCNSDICWLKNSSILCLHAFSAASDAYINCATFFSMLPIVERSAMACRRLENACWTDPCKHPTVASRFSIYWRNFSRMFRKATSAISSLVKENQFRFYYNYLPKMAAQKA